MSLFGPDKWELHRTLLTVLAIDKSKHIRIEILSG